jgi:Protein of unknown function (DUF2914)
MKRLSKMIRVAMVCALVASAGVAMADDAKPKADEAKPKAPAADADKPKAPATDTDKPKAPATDTAPSSGSAAAEIKVGTGYEKHAVAGEAQSFPSGTKVFAVSTVTGASGTSVKHVWKKDGAEIWTATLAVGSNKWTTSSRRVLGKAGQYEIDVVGADGAELGKVEFAIQ